MAQSIPPLTKKVLRFLQVEKSPRAMEEVAELWNESHQLLDIYRWSLCVPVDEFFARFHPFASESRAVAGLLAGAHRIWLMAVTLGNALERRSREYFAQNQAFCGYILDRMGSFLVEDEIRKLDEKIIRECKHQGSSTTRRYSPGYQDFSLESQRVFLEMIGPNMPGLKLTSGLLLKPEKTITAVKGVIQDGSDADRKN
jgi:hypothetical protein